MRDDSPLQQLAVTTAMIIILLTIALLASCLPKEEGNHTVDAEKLLEECEKDLPRSKTCRIIAVGDEEDRL